MDKNEVKKLKHDLGSALGEAFTVFDYLGEEVLFRRLKTGDGGRVWFDREQWLLSFTLSIDLDQDLLDEEGEDAVLERCREQVEDMFRFSWEERGYELADDHDWGSGSYEDGEGKKDVAIFQVEALNEVEGIDQMVAEIKETEKAFFSEWLEE